MARKIFSDETIHTWELYPLMIQWHQYHRQFISTELPGNPCHHINALLIMSSAVMIEGALSSLLLFYLKGPYSPIIRGINVLDPVFLFNERNRELLITQVSSATWKNYKSLFQIITGKSLPELCVSTWEAVTYLFYFRNLLFHGEQLNISGAWIPEEGVELNEIKRNKNELFCYLEKKNFINKPKFGKTIGWTFLNDDIADHFIVSSRAFLTHLVENVPDSQEAETIPKRIKKILSLTAQPLDSSFNKPLYSDSRETGVKP